MKACRVHSRTAYNRSVHLSGPSPRQISFAETEDSIYPVKHLGYLASVLILYLSDDNLAFPVYLSRRRESKGCKMMVTNSVTVGKLIVNLGLFIDPCERGYH